jgi:uncharacterized membrane protein YidH (DUF202 family)
MERTVQPLFDLDDVRITPYVAQFGETYYQIASVSSVRVAQGKKLSRLALLVLLLGVGLLIAAVLRSCGSEVQADANFPLAVAAVSIVFSSLLVQFVLPRRIFKLILRTHGSDNEVLTSDRKQFILDVRQAVESAFIAHAERSSLKQKQLIESQRPAEHPTTSSG